MGDIVERLRASHITRWHETMQEAADEIERLRAALGYYADLGCGLPNEGPWGAYSTDFGDIARAALKGDE